MLAINGQFTMSSVKEKIFSCPLDDQSEYALGRIWVAPRIDFKAYRDTLHHILNSSKNDDGSRQASDIILTASSDQAWRAARTVIGGPVKMSIKLDSRHDSETTASRIAKM